jgi:hypothetical protein
MLLMVQLSVLHISVLMFLKHQLFRKMMNVMNNINDNLDIYLDKLYRYFHNLEIQYNVFDQNLNDIHDIQLVIHLQKKLN